MAPYDPDPDPPGDPPVEDSDSVPGESAEAPCDMPEVEPNNTPAEATILPMEERGCGLFHTSVDGDYWRFEMPEEGWLAVDVDGYRIGSKARLSVALADLDRGGAVGLSDWRGLPEPHFRVPTGPAPFQLFIRQTVGTEAAPGEGEDWFYEVRASVTKPPVTWDVDEVANEARGAAQRLLSAAGTVAVFGTLDAPTDQDWFEVVVPPGRFLVTFDVDAHDFGSVADLSLELDRQLPGDETIRSGRLGYERDPWFQLRNVDAETLRVRVLEYTGQSGRAFWYVLRVSVEEE